MNVGEQKVVLVRRRLAFQRLRHMDRTSDGFAGLFGWDYGGLGRGRHAFEEWDGQGWQGSGLRSDSHRDMQPCRQASWLTQASAQASWQAARRRVHGQDGSEMEELEITQGGQRVSTGRQATTQARM